MEIPAATPADGNPTIHLQRASKSPASNDAGLFVARYLPVMRLILLLVVLALLPLGAAAQPRAIASQPGSDPVLTGEVVRCSWATPLPGEAMAWGLSNDKPQQLVTIGIERIKPFRINWEPNLSMMIYPLHQKRVIVGLADAQTKQWICWRLWDGKQWLEEKSLVELVHKHVSSVLAAAPRAFATYRASEDALPHHVQIATDGAGHLWFAHEKHLEFYDGQSWRDAWSEIGGAPQRSFGLTAVHQGSALVLEEEPVTDPSQSGLRLIVFQNQKLVSKPLPPIRPGVWNVHFSNAIDISATETIYQMPTGAGILRGTQAEAYDQPQTPVLADTAGNLWWTDQGGRIVVTSGAKRTFRVIRDTPDPRTVVQSPNGRYWLLHRNGVVGLNLVKRGAQPWIEVTQRFKWDAPRTEFKELFCDADEGLWFVNGGAHLHYALPRGASK
ncbi:MAG TPA: hypothetical protein VF669_02735 [Tepidisphaeraceae bacterium]|jgi:hypothetical protein